MKYLLVFAVLFCLIACVTTSPEPKEKVASNKVVHKKFIRYDGVKQPLYYPANFYSYDDEQAQDRSARAWWNQ